MIDFVKKWQPIIEGYARQSGLDFYPVIFETVDFDIMSQLAARGGFPIRYPHWRFGMEYDQLSKGYRYGLQKIYEMVINNNPCYAYLLQSNSEVDQKLVMAHVYAHCDFFKNNYYFSPTNRKMINEMANHAIRVRNHIEKWGLEKVETFIDICLSLENLIDRNFFYIKRVTKNKSETTTSIKKIATKDYLDNFINPPEEIEKQREAIKKKKDELPSNENLPTMDILALLLKWAPLKDWEIDILEIIRDEAYYFVPQAMTKIMNEGWATFWHSRLMTRHILKPSEVVDYAIHHSGTIAIHQFRLNPYRMGYLMFLDIEDRWNKGQFGPDYWDCDDYQTKKRWNKKLGLGLQKIFEIRKIYNDLNFVDEFLTEDFAREHRLFTYRYNSKNDNFVIDSRDFQAIKKALLHRLTNAGNPIISAVDINYQNRGELYLRHHYDGMELDVEYAKDTLYNLWKIWKRPVIIEFKYNNNLARLKHDGKEAKFL